MAEFLLGTSSWSEKSWEGVFYPSGLPAGDWLSFYATRFRAVEADVTYYRVPSRSMVAGWSRKLPAGFVLAAKFPRGIVHGGEAERPDPARVLVAAAVREDVDRFLEAMALMGDRLGTLPPEFRIGVEIRNRAWLDERLTAILRRHRAALVLVDLSYMPHPADLAAEIDVVTTDFVYARLIGDRRAVEKATATFDRVVLDQGARLERWAGLLRSLGGRAQRIFTFANNHYAGHAPATIADLAARLLGPDAEWRPRPGAPL